MEADLIAPEVECTVRLNSRCHRGLCQKCCQSTLFCGVLTQGGATFRFVAPFRSDARGNECLRMTSRKVPFRRPFFGLVGHLPGLDCDRLDPETIRLFCFCLDG